MPSAYSRTLGGSSAVWTPARLASLAAEWDAASLGGSPVTTWKDRISGYTFDSDASRPPTWGAKFLGSQPGVRFRWLTNLATYDGQVLRSTDAGFMKLFSTYTHPVTVHIIGTFDSYRLGDTNDYYALWAAYGDVGTKFFLYTCYGYNNAGNSEDYLSIQRRADGGAATRSSAYSAASFPDAMMDTRVHVLTMQWTGATLNTYVDGVTLPPLTTTFVTDPGDTTLTHIQLGEDYENGSGDTPMATLGAIYVQATAVSAGDLANLVAYAQERWQ